MTQAFFWCYPWDVEDEGYERALGRMAGDAELRGRLGRAGHRALRERWTESVVLEQYFELIARVAEKKDPDLHRALVPSRAEPRIRGEVT